MTHEYADLTARIVEFRTRLIRTLMFLIAASVIAYVFSSWMLGEMLTRLPGSRVLVFLSPAEAFLSRIKLAIAGGLVLTVPFLLFQVVRFVTPRLPQRERRVAFALIPLAVLLFLLGAAFGYTALLPFALEFLLGFAGPELEPMLSLASYINFVLLFVFPLGLIFQLPIVITLFARLGILDPRALARRRKYAVLAIFVVSALLTPADFFSQLLMAGPLLILFEISLLIARVVSRRHARGRA